MDRSLVFRGISVSLLTALLVGCGTKGVNSNSSDAAYCGQTQTTGAGSTGTAKIFNIDPMVAANSATLSPGSASLDSYTTSATLTNLLGTGVLSGAYVQTVTDRCTDAGGEPTYGAFSATNDFSISHSDERFAESMTYHYGNLYREDTATAGALYPTSGVPFQIIANCDQANNAYYTQRYVNGSLLNYVCIGYSSNYSTSTFADDSEVVVHELQHGMTGNSYSTTVDLNQLAYDEAGTINEALSDFVALMNADPDISSPFKAFEFSRWALGQLFTESMMRGTAKCPAWTSDYPTCSNFSKTASGFSAANKRVSFAYPDGLGWPYAGPSTGSTLKAAWTGDFGGGFEEIHQAAPVIEGALYDAYVAEKAGGAFGSAAAARHAMFLLVAETMKVLPKPSVSNPSPVTVSVFATTMVSTMNTTLSGTFNNATKTSAVTTALSDRGLTNIPTVADGWAGVGTHGSSTNHAGVYFYETTPVGVRNYRINAGETGYVWLDITNSDADSAVAPLVKVTITGGGGKVRFSTSNYGYVSSTVAYIRYGKVNGSSYVAAVNDGTTAQNTGMTTDYVLGNWAGTADTGLIVNIDSTASGSFTFDADITVDNQATPGHIESKSFPVTF